MTDQETIEAMLKKREIPFMIALLEGKDSGEVGKNWPTVALAIKVDVNSPRSQNVMGYLGFETQFFFDGQGNFLGLGIWE